MGFNSVFKGLTDSQNYLVKRGPPYIAYQVGQNSLPLITSNYR